MGDGPTRIELLNQIAHRLNKNPPPAMDAATETRLASYLNQRQRRLLSMPGLARLRDATIMFVSVADRAAYGLPNLAKIARMFERDNDRTLFEMSLQDYRLVQPTPISGTPEAYVWTGRQVVAQQPVAPTALWVTSSHAGDTALIVYVQGVLATGVQQLASATLNGLTAVNVAPAVASWARVDKWYLAGPALGTVQLVAASAVGPSLAAIPPGSVTSVYTGLTLHPTPSAAITYYVDVTRTVTDLVHGTDQAAIPDDFADLLVLGALADEYQHLSDPRWGTVMTEYKERENQLKYWLAETAIGRPFGLAQSFQRPSQLGPWFESGT